MSIQSQWLFTGLYNTAVRIRLHNYIRGIKKPVRAGYLKNFG